MRQQPTVSESASQPHRTPLIGAHKAAPLVLGGSPTWLCHLYFWFFHLVFKVLQSKDHVFS